MTDRPNRYDDPLGLGLYDEPEPEPEPEPCATCGEPILPDDAAHFLPDGTCHHSSHGKQLDADEWAEAMAEIARQSREWRP